MSSSDSDSSAISIRTTVEERWENGLKHIYHYTKAGKSAIQEQEKNQFGTWRIILVTDGVGKQLDNDGEGFDWSKVKSGSVVHHIPRVRGFARTKQARRRHGKWSELNKHLDNNCKVIPGYEKDADGKWYWSRSDSPPDPTTKIFHPNEIPDDEDRKPPVVQALSEPAPETTSQAAAQAAPQALLQASPQDAPQDAPEK